MRTERLQPFSLLKQGDRRRKYRLSRAECHILNHFKFTRIVLTQRIAMAFLLWPRMAKITFLQSYRNAIAFSVTCIFRNIREETKLWFVTTCWRQEETEMSARS